MPLRIIVDHWGEVPLRRQVAVALGTGEIVVPPDVAFAAGRASSEYDLVGEVDWMPYTDSVERFAGGWPGVRIGAVPGRLVGHLDHVPAGDGGSERDFAGCEDVVSTGQRDVFGAPGRQPQFAVGRDDEGEGLGEFTAVAPRKPPREGGSCIDGHSVHPRHAVAVALSSGGPT
ncbi:hypothetical protein ACFFX1_14710 [Dactylosporangium sucinum]|uniref:hypothetical protein n=1 Tax=Dactylosporangium sucinum TaxID=1424081 RepID=UPI00167F09F4|nr:hypothetical protein [Dactylosporangium sucinum]